VVAVWRKRYYLRNQKRKSTMFRTRGKNDRRDNYEEMFKNIPEGKKTIGKPRKRRLDDVKNCVNKICVTACRKVTGNRDASKLILKKAKG
jgi:hypothetical protein